MRKRAETPLRIGTVSNYRHLWMLVFWVIYLVLFAVVEHAVQSDYYVMHCALDDVIPFCEWFILPYCLWHPLLFAMTLYLAFWDAENFKPYMLFIALGFIPVILFDWAFPNGQDLRPAVFAHQNVATWLVGRIYAADTNTNVFPSSHRLCRARRRHDLYAVAAQAEAAPRCDPGGHSDLHLHRVRQAALLPRSHRRDPVQRPPLVAHLRRDLQKAKESLILVRKGCGFA